MLCYPFIFLKTAHQFPYILPTTKISVGKRWAVGRKSTEITNKKLPLELSKGSNFNRQTTYLSH